MLAAARLDESRGTVVITLPDGSEHAADDPDVHSALSAWLDNDVRLEPPPADGVFPMEMYSGMSDEDTPAFDWHGPPRRSEVRRAGPECVRTSRSGRSRGP